ncbi:MAG: glycosyltransferase family 39 protein [Planctomycetota bacterium]
MIDERRTPWFWLALIGTTGVALAMRLLWIDRPSFWIDELYTVMHSCRFGDGNLTKQLSYVPTLVMLSLADALPAAEQAMQPELWRELGVTETLVRLPSAMIGGATVFLLGWLARGMVGSRAALWFAVLLAVSVWHLHMSQTGRFYVQQLLFYNLGLLLYWRATSIGSVWRLVLSMAMLFLGFMSQPPALILGVVIAVDWALGVRSKDPSRLTIAAFAAGAVTAAACAGVLLVDVYLRTDEWAQFAGNISQSAPKLVLGVVWVIGPVTVLLAAVGWLRVLASDRRLAIYLAAGATFPVIAMAALGLTGTFVHVRYTFVALPAWLLLAAVGAVGGVSDGADLPTRVRAMMPGVLVAVASLVQCFGYYTGGGGYRPAWRDAVEYIAANRQRGDLVAGDEHAFWHARYYLGDSSAVKVQGAALWDLLETTDRRVWILDKGGTSGAMNWSGLRDRADLRWYFDRKILQPFSTVKVFLFDPTEGLYPDEGLDPGADLSP